MVPQCGGVPVAVPRALKALELVALAAPAASAAFLDPAELVPVGRAAREAQADSLVGAVWQAECPAVELAAPRPVWAPAPARAVAPVAA